MNKIFLLIVFFTKAKQSANNSEKATKKQIKTDLNDN